MIRSTVRLRHEDWGFRPGHGRDGGDCCRSVRDRCQRYVAGGFGVAGDWFVAGGGVIALLGGLRTSWSGSGVAIDICASQARARAVASRSTQERPSYSVCVDLSALNA